MFSRCSHGLLHEHWLPWFQLLAGSLMSKEFLSNHASIGLPTTDGSCGRVVLNFLFISTANGDGMVLDIYVVNTVFCQTKIPWSSLLYIFFS